ncbi:translation initiation factor IF-2 [Flavobacterium sp. 9AF]|uniref:translation initiation factor IF-2 n=1 Tax=Flavobacterium sp. 9AF TaxID=2653142 RepID=UPI0012EF804D|nr:translation initiation factor IF-2 [Flavobacterium sp. 9AF]VXB17342.1 translation initiation factor IF-2 [Flavobacterium sp. 9AF]
MSDKRVIRINKVLRELNISLDRAVDFLKEKDHEIEASPNAKISQEEYDVLCSQFSADKGKKVASLEVSEEKKKEKEALKKELEKEVEIKRQHEEQQKQEVIKARASLVGPKAIGKIDLNPKKVEPKQETPLVQEQPVEQPIKQEEIKIVEEVKPKVEIEKPKIKVVEKVEQPKVIQKPSVEKNNSTETVEEDKIATNYQKLSGATFTGQKIDLSQFNKPKKKIEPRKDFKKPGDPKAPNSGANNANSNNNPNSNSNKNKRKRITKPAPGNNNGQFNQQPQQGGGVKKDFSKDRFNKGKKVVVQKTEPTEEEVKNQIKETLERLQGKGKKGSKAAKYRKDKRDSHRQRLDDELQQQDLESKILKVTEFVTVGEIASLMDVPITKVIGTCMSLGIMVTMNQRLDAETLSIVADEFGYEVEFITTDIEEAAEVVEDNPEDLTHRAPIVTVMGHVDHGKTSLLDYIREENVIAGESGGITQHIGAYSVELEDGQKIAFLDTPGHEAFTAMRARGAQVTDIAIIVIAADDDIMPQTKEAISHAQAAGVPMIFAINKIDKPTANPEKIKERLAGMNLLVEDWGGKYQSHDISAKTGLGVKELLEKVLLEAEVLELKANPKKNALGTVVEAQLDKGRGYVATILVQAGTLRIGDYMLAGKNHGKIKAMFDERGHNVTEAGPSTPVSILGLDGAPTAGDKFNVYDDEREAKQIAAKRTQLQREQSARVKKHTTLDEIGRRIALGQFKELNIIIKGDVDGSVEALSDSFSKLSTEEIEVKIIHKGVGAITESDVLLASASDAIIIGFNVRPQGNAKALAEKEEIDIRNYSIIYAAIDDLKDAMEGMLSPELKEEITGTAEVRELFKISKVGTIAGCMVTDGKIFRNSQIRLIREGVVIYTGELATLKRFKDDVKEVSKGYDCGMQIKDYNDLKEYDLIEAFQEVEVKKKLK